MDDPLITVLMPVYNAMPYLTYAVDSILNQTEQRFVLIAIDDGSIDDSLIYLRSVQSPKMKVYEYGKNGLIKTLNYGLSLVQTPFVAIMDADDISEINRLKFELDFLQKNHDFVLVGTSVSYFGESHKGSEWRIKLPSDHDELIMGLRKGKAVITHATVMIRNSALQKIGGYKEDSFPIPDYDMFLRISSEGKLANLTDVYCRIRFHEKSFTSNNLFVIIEKLYEQINNKKESGPLNYLSRILKKLRILVNYTSVNLYRMGIMFFVNDKKIAGIFLIIVSGVFQPFRGIYYLRKKLSF